MRTRIFGIKVINVNGTPIHTINVTVNASAIIAEKVINDKFWKHHHMIFMSNSKSKINFKFTTTDSHQADVIRTSLTQILFAHKLQKLVKESFFVKDKENVIWDTLAEIKDINGGSL